MLQYDDVVKSVADEICAKQPSHPVRVAIDGRTAAGKSTFAANLKQALKRAQRTVVATSIDDFHNPKIVRYRKGRSSPLGYYKDARNLEAIVELLLKPLGPGGNRQYRRSYFDLEKDLPVDAAPCAADTTDIFIVDGTFLGRPELTQFWDYFVFLDVCAETARARASAREGHSQATCTSENLYQARYGAAFEIYLTETDPWRRADVIVKAEDFDDLQPKFKPSHTRAETRTGLSSAEKNI